MLEVKEEMIIPIKGIEYKLCFVKDMVDCSGMTDKKKREIVIELTEDSEVLFRTIIHELIHAYFHESGLEGYCNDETLISWLDYHFFELYNLFEEIFTNSKTI